MSFSPIIWNKTRSAPPTSRAACLSSVVCLGRNVPSTSQSSKNSTGLACLCFCCRVLAAATVAAAPFRSGAPVDAASWWLVTEFCPRINCKASALCNAAFRALLFHPYILFVPGVGHLVSIFFPCPCFLTCACRRVCRPGTFGTSLASEFVCGQPIAFSCIVMRVFRQEANYGLGLISLNLVPPSFVSLFYFIFEE